MKVWEHSECGYNFEHAPQQPITCPMDSPIPECSDPSAGFDLLCSDAHPKV